MNILIADKFDRSGIEALEKMGCKVTLDPDLKDDALTAAIKAGECKILIVRSTKVTAEMMTTGDTLALIIRAGAGYNTIDVDAASRASIMVANCPGKNAIAVAELTLGLILALDRRIVENVVDLRNGQWKKKQYAKAPGLKNKTLGIVGMGQIGQAVASRAQAFEMNVVAWSRSLTPEQADELDITYAASPVEVARKCDILTVHLAAAPETKNIINHDVFDALPENAYFINTARADVVDHEALTAAMKAKNLRVGLDVFPSEPSTGEGEVNEPLFQSDNIIYGTHHIGASTDQSQEAIAEETIRIVKVFKSTGRVENCVNLATPSEGGLTLTIRHLNRPGVLAHVLNEISMSGINVEEMDNVLCAGGHAATAHLKLSKEPSGESMNRIRGGNENILALTLSKN
jgi:D-3-phosphoglycerate dehydrogenase